MSVSKEKLTPRPSTSVGPPKKRRKPFPDDRNASSFRVSAMLISEDDRIQQQQQPAPERRRPSTAADVPQDTPSPVVPALMSLPPSLLSPYPYPSLPYYPPLYHGGPFYLRVGSSPPLTPHSRAKAGNPPRILPKAAVSSSSSSFVMPVLEAAHGQGYFASPPLHPHNPEYIYHPFNIAIAPVLPLGPGEVRESHSTADQREHARKISHSAIERRRRERINDKIAQLRQLIPSCSDKEHLHKMTVLQSAIDYIAYLKSVVLRLDGGPAQTIKKNYVLSKSATPVTPEDEIVHNNYSGDQEEAIGSHEQKGMKPIDGIPATPLPTPSSSSPPLLTKTPGSPRQLDRIGSPEGSSNWSEYGSSSSTPSLGPQPVSHQRHMSVENLLC
ncbi:hypothetical protein BX666DRAFT_2108124 [Dichotomocladium elegans]|nr:hypothetical protein BX666DRAFT_2108124 [Dichotomocladium elegans]